jgi:hypothetical protein
MSNWADNLSTMADQAEQTKQQNCDQYVRTFMTTLINDLKTKESKLSKELERTAIRGGRTYQHEYPAPKECFGRISSCISRHRDQMKKEFSQQYTNVKFIPTVYQSDMSNLTFQLEW